jgi:hypothetical protein
MTEQLGGAGLSTLSWTCCSEVQRHSFECRRAVDIPSPLQDREHLLRRQASIGPTSCRCRRRSYLSGQDAGAVRPSIGLPSRDPLTSLLRNFTSEFTDFYQCDLEITSYLDDNGSFQILRIGSEIARIAVIPRRVAIRLGGSGNRSGQCQGPWKYIGIRLPHSKIGSKSSSRNHIARITWRKAPLVGHLVRYHVRSAICADSLTADY